MNQKDSAFQKLSSSLQAKIISRPTKTFLVDSTKETEAKYKKASQVWNIEEPNPKLRAPESFDGRIVWKGLLGEVSNQGSCGSCWAFASTDALEQRFNIQSRGLMNINLSPAKLIICDWGVKQTEVEHQERPEFAFNLVQAASLTPACHGNTLLDACRFLYQIGTTTEECVPYYKVIDTQSGTFQQFGSFQSDLQLGAQLPLCTAATGPVGDLCVGSYFVSSTGEESDKPSRFYRAFHYYTLYGIPGKSAEEKGGEIQIRREIWRWGPVATGMKVYPDFYTFDASKEIYKWNGKGPQVGGHAVVIIGWGEEKGVKYWIIRNSWGPKWGDKGHFRMRRGTNECDIEANVVCVMPDFFYPTNYTSKDKRQSTGPGKPPVDNELKLIPDDDIRKERNSISDDISRIGGGIDPLTGYTRRVMITMPWLNFQRPVFLEDLPKWSTFIAGIDSSSKNRAHLLSTGDAVKEKGVNENQIKQIYVFVISILVILTVFILLLIIYDKLKH
jgi:cathepsin B